MSASAPHVRSDGNRHRDASKIIHIWPYKSLDERQAVRDKAKMVLATYLNPGDELEVQTQENKIMLPAQLANAQNAL